MVLGYEMFHVSVSICLVFSSRSLLPGSEIIMRDTFSRSPQDQHTLIQFPNHRASFPSSNGRDYPVLVGKKSSFISIALPKSSCHPPILCPHGRVLASSWLVRIPEIILNITVTPPLQKPEHEEELGRSFPSVHAPFLNRYICPRCDPVSPISGFI